MTAAVRAAFKSIRYQPDCVQTRGLVLDVNPVTTARAYGIAAGSGWDYESDRPELGLNPRWGATANLTMNGAGGSVAR